MGADAIAKNWERIGDDSQGYQIPENQTDEWRIVAELRGIKV